jgi:hypothetical protein
MYPRGYSEGRAAKDDLAGALVRIGPARLLDLATTRQTLTA